MSNAAASYIPDMQVMTLKPEFEAFVDPDKQGGFSTPEQVAIFLHEWIHYLHNVSTMLGLTTFCNLTIVWSNFRWTFGEDGWSHGATDIDAAEAQNIERQYGYMQVLRGRRSNTLPKDAAPEEVRFTRVTAVPADTGRPDELQLLACDVEHLRSTGAGPQTHQLLVGTHDILECAAFLLEERAAIAMGTVPTPPPFDPYLLVLGIARLLAPSLSKEEVLMATLASLQYPDPPRVLLQLLACGEDARCTGHDPERAIRNEGTRLLEACWPSAVESLRLLEEMFPLDEPMARVVKQTVARLRANMARRRQNIFFELDIVERLRVNITSLNESIRLYGAPVLIQQRRGHDDQLGRDLMYEFQLQEMPVEELSKGWRLMHAAYRFVGAHLRGGQLLCTNEAAFSKCPFYTACDKEYRKGHPEHCRQQPWLAATSGASTCDYGVAVRITRPPAQAFRS